MARGGYRDTYDRDYQNSNANRGRGMLCDILFVLVTSNKLLLYTNKFRRFLMQVTSHEEARGAAERCDSHIQHQAADFVR